MVGKDDSNVFEGVRISYEGLEGWRTGVVKTFLPADKQFDRPLVEVKDDESGSLVCFTDQVCFYVMRVN
ncbi:MAG: hypothetical protein KKF56_05785 [Nanoarchaeota archaeon]|nr:hypothetical protein [Nanoarchaeota archaeon]